MGENAKNRPPVRSSGKHQLALQIAETRSELHRLAGAVTEVTMTYDRNFRAIAQQQNQLLGRIEQLEKSLFGRKA